MAEYIFTPTGGRVSSDNELPRPLFVPVDAAEKKAAPARAKRATTRKAKADPKE